MKKSQSQIVSTVILILIVITTVVIVMNFVIPFVKDRLDRGKCLEYTERIEIRNNMKYTCFNHTSNETLVQVHIGEVGELYKGFVIEIGAASSETFKIVNGTTFASGEVRMFDGSTTLETPGINEERTYIIDPSFDEKPGTIKVYPLLINDKTCDPMDAVTTVSICPTFY